MTYTMPPDHNPRPRADIERDIQLGYDYGGTNDFHANAFNQNVAIEVLLDIRDLVAESNIIASRIESNTEAVAVRAERMLPVEQRADPPIMELRESRDIAESNELLRAGWRLLGSNVDPYGVSNMLFGRSTHKEATP